MTTLPLGETQQVPDPKSPAEVQQEPREGGLHQVHQVSPGGDQDISGRETLNISSSLKPLNTQHGSLSLRAFKAVTVSKNINQSRQSQWQCTNNTYNITYNIHLYQDI